MTTHVAPSSGLTIVTLSCDLCPAQVIHTDVVPLNTVSAYLTASGWRIVELGATTEQSTLCPRCALAGGHQ